MSFLLPLSTVAIMVLYAVPGYLFLRTGAIRAEHIPPFAKVLLYLCQPCLTLYSFNKADYSLELLKNMGIFFLLSTVLQLLMLGGACLVLRKKCHQIRYRIFTVATVLGNVGFLGVPLLEALLPEYSNAVALSAAYIVSMNLISWTLGLTVITKDKTYLSVKKILLSPPFLTLLIALPLFLTGSKLPSILETPVSLLGKMTTPLCMLILGMRLATVPLQELISDWRVFFTCGAKQILFPLLSFAAVAFLPLEFYIKATLLILCCCPTASVVQSLSELYGDGQQIAANTVLVSTFLSVLTIPLMLSVLL